MYTNIKSIQILISLLKANNIRDIVLSPGGSDIPVIHSIETDEFFTCYSVVDERSAAYFAMGVAQEKCCTVACVCTSGTAVCNYLPGITEAFYQNVPIVAITCDKNPYFQEQLETQKIEQTTIFNGVVKKSVNLPIIVNEEDEWLCNRLINEALLEVDHHGQGPVQINIPIVTRTDIYDCQVLPVTRKIERLNGYLCNWADEIADKLSKYQKIMVVVGQNVYFDDEFKNVMEKFFDNYNCIFSVEHLSNLNCKGVVYTYPVTEICPTNDLLPDLVISIGNNLASYGLKPFLRANYKKIDNWYITERGEVRDAYKSLKLIVECTPKHFFKTVISSNRIGNHDYFDLWIEKLTKIKLPDFEYSNFMVAEKLSKIIPSDSVLHLAILNSTRIMQFFKLNANIRTYSNVGTLGIDGCLSTFAGQASCTEKLAFLVIGDLSFFYDMNAASLRNIGPNVRIILLNNGGGSEFHFFMGKEKIPTINQYICAEHDRVATGWAVSLGYDYYAVSTEKELEDALAKTVIMTEHPQFIEVFTDMEEDAARTNNFYDSNRKDNGEKTGILKQIAFSFLSETRIEKAKKILDILREQ